jgi:SAM-dependent methyltransferase
VYHPPDSPPSDNRFDSVADRYVDLLDRSVSISGEGSAYFADYKARYLARTLSRAFDGRVLEYGCGVGLLSDSLRRHLPKTRLDGYDTSAASVGRARERLGSAGVFTHQIHQIRSDYDLIVLSNVLHHVIGTERQALVSSLARRLSDGGRLVAFEHNPLNPLTRWAVAHCPFDEGVQLLPVVETERYMAGAGLRRTRRDYIVFFPRPLAWLRFVEASLGWCPLGAQYAVTAVAQRCPR